MAIREKVTKNTELSFFEGKIPLSYRYTYGLAGEKFFRKALEGKLIASVAKESGIIYCPPRIFCEESFEEIGEMIEIKPTGTLVSFTVSFEDGDGNRQAPQIIAMVVFDEADTGFVAPMKCDLEDVCIGMRVKLEYVPKKERKGAITDMYFVPSK